jgi:hypothetical protein
MYVNNAKGKRREDRNFVMIHNMNEWFIVALIEGWIDGLIGGFDGLIGWYIENDRLVTVSRCTDNKYINI